MTRSPSIAVLVPCYQEELTVGKVVSDFKAVLPDAVVYVYDNNSTDRTAEEARKAGAIVRREKRQGKGYVVASMFEQVNADILIMVDGDDTYEASAAPQLIAPLLSGDADITVGTRLKTYGADSFRPLHVFGNRMVCGVINRIFGANISDIFSGYRAFTRQSALLIPVTTRGFDVETELMLQALYRGFIVTEIPTRYSARPEGSFSKLNTVSDGFRIILRLFLIIKSYKPLAFFGSIGLFLLLMGLLAGAQPIYEYATERYVHTLPRAVLAAGLMLSAFLTFGLGLMLNSTNLRMLELERLIVKLNMAASRPKAS